jgi:hypothetical protein
VSLRDQPRLDAWPDPPWRLTAIGHAETLPAPDGLALTTHPTPESVYSDAQISDYSAPAGFRWRPPLRLTVRARSAPGADALRGTAGFGFWNQPFMPGQMALRLPQAAWFFFSSPPSDMRLARGVPGPGWKAATLNAARWPFLALLPAAPVGVLLMRNRALYDRLWPVGQRAIAVSERLLDSALLADWHTYTLEWGPDGVAFAVDGAPAHRAPAAPPGPLGFIAWIDNQYAVVTPQGQFSFGLLPLDAPQTLHLSELIIEAV